MSLRMGNYGEAAESSALAIAMLTPLRPLAEAFIVYEISKTKEVRDVSMQFGELVESKFGKIAGAFGDCKETQS